MSFRGWIDPDGERYHTIELATHDDHAELLLKRFYPKWRWEDDPRCGEGSVIYASWALEVKGWLRVVCPGSYSLWELRGPAKDNLIDLVADLDEDQALHVGLLKGGRFPYRTAGEFLEAA